MDTVWSASDRQTWFNLWKGQKKEKGRQAIKNYLQLAKELNGLYTINWHNSRLFTLFGRDYQNIIQQALDLGCSVWSFRDIAIWYKNRCELLESCTFKSKEINLVWKKGKLEKKPIITGHFPKMWKIKTNQSLKPLSSKSSFKGETEYLLND